MVRTLRCRCNAFKYAGCRWESYPFFTRSYLFPSSPNIGLSQTPPFPLHFSSTETQLNGLSTACVSNLISIPQALFDPPNASCVFFFPTLSLNLRHRQQHISKSRTSTTNVRIQPIRVPVSFVRCIPKAIPNVRGTDGPILLFLRSLRHLQHWHLRRQSIHNRIYAGGRAPREHVLQP